MSCRTGNGFIPEICLQGTGKFLLAITEVQHELSHYKAVEQLLGHLLNLQVARVEGPWDLGLVDPHIVKEDYECQQFPTSK